MEANHFSSSAFIPQLATTGVTYWIALSCQTSFSIYIFSMPNVVRTAGLRKPKESGKENARELAVPYHGYLFLQEQDIQFLRNLGNESRGRYLWTISCSRLEKTAESESLSRTSCPETCFSFCAGITEPTHGPSTSQNWEFYNSS
jgi:hypothetical protein